MTSLRSSVMTPLAGPRRRGWITGVVIDVAGGAVMV